MDLANARQVILGAQIVDERNAGGGGFACDETGSISIRSRRNATLQGYTLLIGDHLDMKMARSEVVAKHSADPIGIWGFIAHEADNKFGTGLHGVSVIFANKRQNRHYFSVVHVQQGFSLLDFMKKAAGPQRHEIKEKDKN